jgi:hypothetical protein
LDLSLLDQQRGYALHPGRLGIDAYLSYARAEGGRVCGGDGIGSIEPGALSGACDPAIRSDVPALAEERFVPGAPERALPALAVRPITRRER